MVLSVGEKGINMGQNVLTIDWPIFKNIVDERGLSIQWVELSADNYWLAAYDGQFAFDCNIDSNTPSYVEDFEENYKDAGNKSPQAKVVQTLGTDAYTIQPIGFSFSPTKESTTDHDLLLPQAFAIKGGVLWAKNIKHGDYVKVQVIDKDNVLGLGAGIVLSNYVEKWMVFPEPALNEVIDVSIGVLPVAGLYLRVKYTSLSGATVNPDCLLNLYTYLVE